MRPDIQVENHGTLFLLRPFSELGENWLAENLSHAQYFGPAAVVEPRYVADIVEGMQNDGLEVE